MGEFVPRKGVMIRETAKNLVSGRTSSAGTSEMVFYGWASPQEAGILASIPNVQSGSGTIAKGRGVHKGGGGFSSGRIRGISLPSGGDYPVSLGSGTDINDFVADVDHFHFDHHLKMVGGDFRRMATYGFKQFA